MVAKSIAKIYTNIHKPTDYKVRTKSAPNPLQNTLHGKRA